MVLRIVYNKIGFHISVNNAATKSSVPFTWPLSFSPNRWPAIYWPRARSIAHRWILASFIKITKGRIETVFKCSSWIYIHLFTITCLEIIELMEIFSIFNYVSISNNCAINSCSGIIFYINLCTY